MKKLTSIIIVAFAFCVAAVAQTGADPNQGTTRSTPSTSQPSTPQEQPSTPSQQQPGYGQPGTATSQTDQGPNNGGAPAEKAEKKMRGCVQSQGGQYVLEGKKGKTVALTGQEVSAHVGHEVWVKGTWESGGAGAGVSSGASEKTFNVTSVDMISDTCGGKNSKGNSGSTGTSPSSPSPSSSSPSGTGSTSNPPQ